MQLNLEEVQLNQWVSRRRMLSQPDAERGGVERERGREREIGVPEVWEEEGGEELSEYALITIFWTEWTSSIRLGKTWSTLLLTFTELPARVHDANGFRCCSSKSPQEDLSVDAETRASLKSELEVSQGFRRHTHWWRPTRATQLYTNTRYILRLSLYLSEFSSCIYPQAQDLTKRKMWQLKSKHEHRAAGCGHNQKTITSSPRVCIEYSHIKPVYVQLYGPYDYSELIHFASTSKMLITSYGDRLVCDHKLSPWFARWA